MVIEVKEYPSNCCIENFLERLRGERVRFCDEGTRRLLCAQAYYYGIKFEVVKEKAA